MWTRDRLVALASIFAITTLSWLYLASMGGAHLGMAMPGMPGAPLGQFMTAFLLWTVMMVAMMLPTAVLAIDVFGLFAAKRVSATGVGPLTFFFVLGYIGVWTGFSALAAAGQVALAHASLLTSALQSTSIALSAGLLVLAGAFQFSRLKDACLTACRSPFPYFLAHWRDGNAGAFTLGLRYGSYCLGCCWALMGLMFVFGAMNLLWMGALSLFMLAEKLAPPTWRLDRAAGVSCVAGGLLLATRMFH